MKNSKSLLEEISDIRNVCLKRDWAEAAQLIRAYDDRVRSDLKRIPVAEMARVLSAHQELCSDLAMMRDRVGDEISRVAHRAAVSNRYSELRPGL